MNGSFDKSLGFTPVGHRTRTWPACGMVFRLAVLVVLTSTMTTPRAIELAPLTEHEARQLAHGWPAAPIGASAASSASQPAGRSLTPSAADAGTSKSPPVMDGHPLALVGAALALLWWGVQRTRRR